MTHPIYHKHLRKRKAKNLHPYPSKKTFFRLLDYWVSILGVVSSFTLIPQVVQIYANQNADSLSLITWGAYVAWSITMLVYGIAHKSKSISLIYLLCTPLYIAIVAGIIIY